MHRNVWIPLGLLISLVLSSLVLSSSTGWTQSVEQLYQDGLHKEQILGDLRGAIKSYQKAVDRGKANRQIAVQALFRIGLCYERLGKEEAQKVYQRLIQEFPDQRDIVEKARTRLAALGYPERPTPVSTLVVRRVLAGPDVEVYGTPSPNGQYLPYVDWESGDLAVRELATGKKHRLTNKGSWFESDEYALFPVISPDDERIAYTWYNKNGFDLRLIGLDGSNPRALYRNEDVIEPAAWSPDGKHILAVFYRKNQTNQIVVVSVVDGSVRVLKTLDGRPEKMSFSPDGRYIVYDAQLKKDSPNRDIFLLSTDGNREMPLVEHPANDVVLGWAPDGKTILFVSDRRGTSDAWVVQVANGKPQGTPELVKKDIGQIYPMGFTRNGSYYYSLRITMNDVYITELDLSAGTLVAPPERVSKRYEGSNTSPAWSPDGKSLAYCSQRSNAPHEGPDSRILLIHALETGEVRELSPRLRSFIYISYPFCWTSDGRSILITGNDMENRQGIYRVDARTGETTPIVQSEPEAWVGSPVLSPNGKALFYLRRAATTQGFRIFVRDLETGQGREVTPFGNHVHFFSLSPDGQWLVFAVNDPATRSTVVKVMPVAGGEPRELLRMKEPETFSTIAWTPDGQEVLFAKDQRPVGSELWRIRAEGGNPQRVAVLTMGRILHLQFHPDGRRIAFTSLRGVGEVWVIENFLAGLNKADKNGGKGVR